MVLLITVQFCNILEDLFIHFLHVCFPCVRACAPHACLVPMGTRVCDSLEMMLHMAVCCLSCVWALGTNAVSSARAANSSNILILHFNVIF